MIESRPLLGPWTLLVIYVGAGLLCAAVLARRETEFGARLQSALLSTLAWPLWAPIALARESSGFVGRPLEGSAGARILAALDEALAAVRGTPLSALLPEAQVRALTETVDRATRTIAELEAMVKRPEFDVARAAERVSSLSEAPRDEGRTRMLASARVHHANARKLADLLADERRSLDELADLTEALRTQLVLARYAGSSLEGVGDIVGEVWARVQGIDSAMHEPAPPPSSAHAPEAPAPR